LNNLSDVHLTGYLVVRLKYLFCPAIILLQGSSGSAKCGIWRPERSVKVVRK
jgi:hypothetical protein